MDNERLQQNINTLKGYVQTNANGVGFAMEEIEKIKEDVSKFKNFQIDIAPRFSGRYEDLSGKPDLSALDDVIFAADLASLPAAGEDGKIYITNDNGNIYRWDGAAYVPISTTGDDLGNHTATQDLDMDNNDIDSTRSQTFTYGSEYFQRHSPYLFIGAMNVGRLPYIAFNAKLTNSDPSGDNINGFTPSFSSGTRSMGVLRSGAASGDFIYDYKTVVDDPSEVNLTSFETGFILDADNGNFGIGTDSPEQQLHSKVASGNNQLLVETEGIGASEAQLELKNGARAWRFFARDPDFGIFDGVTRFRISGSVIRLQEAGGRVSVSHGSPDTALDVNGATTTRPLSTDPADPADGNSVQWVSDGTGSGDAGDVMMKINVGGTVKTVTIVDYSALA